MITPKDIPRLQRAGLQAAFFNTYNATPTMFQEFTTEISSNKASEDYGWLGANPKLKEWKDERAPKALLEHGFTLKNKDYEATIGVDRNAWQDDQYGQIKVRVQQLATSARTGYDEFAAEVVENGHQRVCYDGQNFFDTDHEEGASGVQTNYSASTMAFALDKIQTIITTMRAYKLDNGQKAGINPSHVMVPTALEFKAKELLDPMYVGVTTDPAKAVGKGLLKVIVNPYLSDTGGANAAYYVLDLTKPVKPFIFQNRQAMQWTAVDQPDAIDNFMRKQLFYGVDARFAFGYGDWRMAYKAQG